MKKLALTLIVITCCAGLIKAQLLWKITGNGITTPSYLVGTHHIAPAGMQDSIPGFNNALASVSQVIGEIDMVSPGAIDTNLMQQYMMASANNTMDKYLTQAQLDSIADTFSKYAGQPIPAAGLLQLRPAAISAQLAMMQSMAAIPGFNPQMQFDTVIQQLALQSGKKIGGLESLKEQLELLYGSPIAEQAADLMKAIRLDATSAEKVKQLAAAYLKGDLNTLNALITDPATGMTTDEAEKLIYRRNANWVEFLIGALPASSMLIAVGAGHLPGEKGVIALLQKAGFNVSPVE